MKISETIARLEEIKKECGDIHLLKWNTGNWQEISKFKVFKFCKNKSSESVKKISDIQPGFRELVTPDKFDIFDAIDVN